MHSPVSLISSYFLNSLWLTPLLWAATALAVSVTRRLGPATTHKIWVAALFAAVLVPSLPIALARVHQAVAATLEAATPIAHHSLMLRTTWGEFPARSALSHHALRSLTFLYLGLLLVSGLRLVRSILLTSRLVRRALPCTLPAPLEHVRQELTRSFGVAPLLLETAELPGPVIAGVRQPLLLLPTNFVETTDTDDFRVAIAHECVHAARQDFLKNLTYQCLSLPVAFHPVCWLIKNHIAQTRELLCDQLAVQRSIDARVYVRSLLRLAMGIASRTQTATVHTIGINDANILEKRVMQLKNAKSTVTPCVRLALLATGLLSLSAATLAGVAAPLAATGLETTQGGQAATLFHVGKDVSAPVLIKEAPPEFPANYKTHDGKLSGTCQVALVVDSSGTPRNVHVVRSFDEAFDKEAVKAVQQYRFKPALHMGKPVPVALRIDVNFQTF